jgi:hypothetical protein
MRADVLVLAGGRPALAFEVRVTHAVGAAKETALAAAGVPVAEVDAHEEWERERDGGAEIAPARSVGFPACAACAALARAEEDRGRGGEAAEIAELEAYRARGLLSPRPLPGVRRTPRPASESSLSPEDRAALASAFRCPECGSSELAFGPRMARHPCARAGTRPVAWLDYDGGVATLDWWRADRPPVMQTRPRRD